MALTLTRKSDGQDVWGKTNVGFWTAVPAASDYPTNGYPITPANVGLRTIRDVFVLGGNQASKQLYYQWDSVNGKLIFMLPTGGASAPATLVAPASAAGTLSGTATPAAGATPVTSTSSQPAIPVTITGGAGSLTAGVGLEVGSLTDVSSISLDLLILGND
jgi:hypothetical protein